MNYLSPRFTQALTFATELHANQTRKISGVPYISHLLGVASLVLEYGGSEDEAIAGLLHDAIEDQGGTKTRNEILALFGDNVIVIIDGCTEKYLQPKPSWRERKETYISNIATASDSVRLVIAADKICNLRSLIKDYALLGEQIWQYFHGGKQNTLWYYEAVIKEFVKKDLTAIVNLLIKVHQEFQELIINNYNSK